VNTVYWDSGGGGTDFCAGDASSVRQCGLSRPRIRC